MSMTQHASATAATLADGNARLGIELGSTRIKAVIVGGGETTLATGSASWENRYVDQTWTYSLDAVWQGIQEAYAVALADAERRHGVRPTGFAAIGISAMMHGYLAFDKDGHQLVPFRTWRNTSTGRAAAELTDLLEYNVPLRWSIAHLYQAVLDDEPHLSELDFCTTLAGYVHWQLTGRKVLGVGDASGMFPIDDITHDWDPARAAKVDDLLARHHTTLRIEEVFPRPLDAGRAAGTLTIEGALLLDPSGRLEAGIPLCPPEGDAGTGMVATNAVAPRTGNVSVGTSIFAMVVLERPLAAVHTEIDLVTTPSGEAVAMAHCNNCTSDLNAWVNLFEEFANSFGMKIDKNELFSVLYNKALEGDADCGGLLAYNYFSGEGITAFDEGRPLFARTPDAKFNLANFMRVHLFTALGALKDGLDILLKEEGVQIDKMYGHGGLFKTPVVGQRIMAAAIDTPVSVMETAGEGGAWGIALLAAYMAQKEEGESLADYLSKRVFGGQEGVTEDPVPADVEGFDQFLKRYNEGLAIERAAVEHL